MSGAPPARPDPHRPRTGRIVGAAIFGLVGAVILVWLGTWQVHRLAWKEGLIAQIQTRLAAAPVPVPADPDPQRDRLLRVTATGGIGGQELDVLASLQPFGVGYRVIVPVTLQDGRRILVDLGFVPEDLKDPAARPPSAPEAPVHVTGLLLWPNETDSFTPQPDLGRNIWFARDVEAMAKALDTDPVLIVAEAHSLGDWPRPQPPGVDLPNNHLEYAITWFSLTAVWLVMTGLWIMTEIRGRRPPVA